MKNIEIKKALKDELKYCDDYKIFIRWFEDCDNTSYVEVCTLIDEDENEWGEGYYIDGLDDLKGYDELSENEIKEIQKKMKQTHTYLKKHFNNVLLEKDLIAFQHSKIIFSASKKYNLMTFCTFF